MSFFFVAQIKCVLFLPIIHTSNQTSLVFRHEVLEDLTHWPIAVKQRTRQGTNISHLGKGKSS